MKATRSKQAQDWAEGRRFRAWELKQNGWQQSRIAEALGVTRGAVRQWMRTARAGGSEALRRRIAPGRQPRLTVAQKAAIPKLLAKGAEAYGFRGEVWTAARIAVVIKKHFGVGYHPAHISKLLKAMGWSVQKPIRRATQRDEAAIAQRHAERWPARKRGRLQQGAGSSG